MDALQIRCLGLSAGNHRITGDAIMITIGSVCGTVRHKNSIFAVVCIGGGVGNEQVVPLGDGAPETGLAVGGATVGGWIV